MFFFYLQILSIIAVLSGEELFINNIHDSDRRGDALTAHAKFENQYGDHLTLLNVFKAYTKSDRVKTWCHDNFLNNRNLGYALDVRNQLKDICTRLHLEFSSCGNNFDQVNVDSPTLDRRINFFSMIILCPSWFFQGAKMFIVRFICECCRAPAW